MSSRHVLTTVLLSAALTAGGLVTATTAAASTTQTFTGYGRSPASWAVIPAARYDARTQATAAGYAPDTECVVGQERYYPPSPTVPFSQATSQLVCTR